MNAQAKALLTCLFFFPLLAVSSPTQTDLAESRRTLDQVLGDYIAIGVGSNLSLQQQDISYERSAQALTEARGAYLPSLTIDARYTRADGGRSIDIPIGSVINPVYATLNQLTQNLATPTNFTPLQDQQFSIQRSREQQTALRITQPLYAPKIAANVRSQRANADAAQFTRDAFRSALLRDIGIAYLNWCKAGQALAIADSNIESLTENLRVNTKLYEAGKITQDQVLRAQAELLSVEQQRVEARNAIARAQRYFNFLINRDHALPLEAAALPNVDTLAPIPLESLLAESQRRRAELRQLDSLQRAADAGIDVARADYKPTLALALEGGTQGEQYRFGRDERYAIGSLVFSWSLFSGNQTRSRVGQARLAAKASAVQLDQARQQISLEVEQAREDLLAALSSLRTATAREDVARAGFNIASKKRDAGVISQVEFLDARTSLADAQSNQNRVRFDVFARAIELDYAAGNPAQHLGALP
jgi:outer membrane protein TolC